jgi:tRNA-splicing ligase RtcB (3'-phosphate/5'-hydroxy nucleic acid ligase)
MNLNQFERINDFEWKIAAGAQPGMRVPVVVFANEAMLKDALQDRSIEQAVNAAALPGLVGNICVMPDVHQGYGFPIGGVAATDFESGVISPGAIGYDINCGVRLLCSDLPLQEAQPFIAKFTTALYHACPSGVGSNGIVRLNSKELRKICEQGSAWALQNGYATPHDIATTEDGGCIGGADIKAAGSRAIERGADQGGSLGAGNHFIEVDLVAEIYDEPAARAMGIHPGRIALQLHSGSRGFGHQICTDYVQKYQSAARKYHFDLPDRELVCAPLQSQEGQEYLAAMRCAANYAFCNRQLLAFSARKTFEDFFPGHYLLNVYDLAHNIGKIETHQVGTKTGKVCVHRKGATRAFPPGHPDLPQQFQKSGQPVLVPGSMGTESWVLAGTSVAMQKSFGSCSHGAGRLLSRTQARKQIHGDQLRSQLMADGIFIQAGSLGGLAEEAPQAYKDIHSVIACIEGAGLGRRVARLTPLAVIKG